MLGTMLASTLVGHIGQNQIAKRMLTEKGGANIVKSLSDQSRLGGIKNGVRNTLVPEAGIMADEVSHGVHAFGKATRGEKAAVLSLMRGDNLEKVLASKTFKSSRLVQNMAAKIGLSPEAIAGAQTGELEAILRGNGVGKILKGMGQELTGINPSTFGKNREIERGVEALGNVGMAIKEPGIAIANGIKRGASAQIQGHGLMAHAGRKLQRISSDEMVKKPLVQNFKRGLQGQRMSRASRLIKRNVVNPVTTELEDFSNQLGLLGQKKS